MQKHFITFLFLLIGGSLFSQTGTIKGRVFNHKNNEPVPFVNIIIDGKPTQGATSDIEGKYIINKVTPGYARLVATSVGFKKFTSNDFLVTNSKTTDLDIGLDEQVTTLAQVEIKPNVVERNEEVPVSLQKLTIQEIERSPGSNRDISKVIQSLPGVASSPSFRNDVIVRGGGPGENRFYLDGVEIPYLNHFSTQGSSGGPVGIINVDFIREVQLYSSAFPTTRGNALSSVMELRQVDGNREKFGGRVSVGSSDFALTLNGPVTKNSSMIFSVRRSYLQLLFSALKLPFLPTYSDYQFKYKIDFDKRNQLSVISIGALDKNKLNTGISNPDGFQKYILQSLPVNDQWSYVFGLVYRHFRAKGYDTWVLSRNMLNNDQIKYTNNVEVPDSLQFKYNSQEIENKLRYEGLTDLVKWKITYGAGLEYARYTNKTFQKVYIADSVVPDSIFTLNYNSRLEMWKWNVFAQVNRAFFNDRLNLNLGIRMDANNYSANMNNLLKQFSPRFSASYAFVPDKFFLNFNIGRYYQLPAYTSLGFRSNSGILVNEALGIKYISADHVVLGLEYQPKPNAKISLEGFYKYYRNYPFSIKDSVALASKGSDFGSVGDEPLLPISKGRAYGFEVLLRNADLYKFNVIMTYTFVRSEFTNYAGVYIPSAWDNRHLINVTVGRKFKHNWEIGAKWRYAGGQPYTPWDMEKSGLVTAWDAQGKGYLNYSKFNTLRLTSFNQLDIRVDKGFFFKKWSLMFYLDIQNVLNFQAQQPDLLVNTQEDGSMVTYVENGQKRYKLRTIKNSAGTVLPAIGIMVDF
ncbi:MAG: TonB-dependent receptor [Bacteroidetes bacterium]|nr:TonB-dependent receptor [Bacteroidota bacterium]